MSGKIHLGRNIAHVRELKGMKQETLATMLGVSQQAVSRLEQSENIDDARLEEVATALGVVPDAIKKFNPEATFNIIANNCYDNSALVNFCPTFNPIDKIVEQADKIEDLYKSLLKSEQEKVKVLTEANKAILDLTKEIGKANNADG